MVMSDHIRVSEYRHLPFRFRVRSSFSKKPCIVVPLSVRLSRVSYKVPFLTTPTAAQPVPLLIYKHMSITNIRLESLRDKYRKQAEKEEAKNQEKVGAKQKKK